MPSPDDTVRASVQSRNVPDPHPDQLGVGFAEDVGRHTIRLEPVVGRAALRDPAHWEIRRQVASSDMVADEHLAGHSCWCPATCPATPTDPGLVMAHATGLQPRHRARRQPLQKDVSPA